MVTAYQIITGKRDAKDEWHDFEHHVNREIKNGWTPLGGVCETVNSSFDRSFAQAMIKESEK
ncbi:MAG TPA: DUF1737 domain-containing protein [Thermoanaerobaculia bacterium]|nr:DUF1737 domain-containing protein [Thermoanaerobaculia bacterium]